MLQKNQQNLMTRGTPAIRTLAIVALAAGSLSLLGCDKDNKTPTTTTSDNRTAGQKVADGADRAGDATDRAIDRTGRATGNAIDRTGDAARNAGDRIGDKASDANDAAHRAGNSVADKTRDVSHDVAESARDTGNTVADNARQAADTVTADSNNVTPHAADMRQVLAQVTNAAVMKDGFDDLVERLAEPDRDRANAFVDAKKDWAEINDVTAAIRQAWQTKYNQEFDMNQPEAIFASDYTTIKETPAADDNNPNATSRSVGTVSLHDNGPSVNLVSEFPNRWKIDVSNTTTGQELYANLLKHLREVRDSQDKWPATAPEAKRVIAKHVLLGVTGG